MIQICQHLQLHQGSVNRWWNWNQGLMVTCGLAGTKSEARRLVQQGGVSVNDEKVTDIGFVVTESMLKDGAKIKKGKKKFHKAIMD